MAANDSRAILFAKISPEIKLALSRTAQRLGMTSQAYAEQAIARALAADADRVSLANAEHEAEVARLSESANALIALASRTRPGAPS